MLERRASAEVPHAHPCLPGHFPDRPVVPAVVLLDLVLDALHAWRGPEWRLQRILSAKFLRPLRPGERFEIALQMTDTRLDFRCERGTSLLAQGRWEMTCGASGAVP
jgi:3-hydroxymyristoyl/3-hydroxydecanoyl-(acyl carrier protein) dehydratase